MIGGRSPGARAPVRRRMRIAFPHQVSGRRTSAGLRRTGPDFARFLVARGHSVRVVTMGDGEPAERPCEIEVVSRRLPFRSVTAQVALAGSAGGARGRRRLRDRDRMPPRRPRQPLRGGRSSAKLVSDPAYERARRYRLFDGHARGVPGRGGRTRTRTEGGFGRAHCGRRRRSSCRAPTSPRSRADGASRTHTDPRAHEPRACRPPKSSPSSLEPGTASSSSAGSRARRRLGIAIEAVAPRAGREARHRRETGPERAELERQAAAIAGASRSALPRLRTRRRDACASSPAPKPASSRATGENLPHSGGRGAVGRRARGLDGRRGGA